MTKIRVLQAVAGPDLSWTPGEIVDLPTEEARKWADGYRAEYVDRGRDRETTDTPRARTDKRRTR